MCEKGVFLCSSSNHEKFSLESPDHPELISEVLLFFLRVGLATQLRRILNLGLQVCITWSQYVSEPEERGYFKKWRSACHASSLMTTVVTP